MAFTIAPVILRASPEPQRLASARSDLVGRRLTASARARAAPTTRFVYSPAVAEASSSGTETASKPRVLDPSDFTTMGDLRVPVMGVGVWSWGDPIYWGYQRDGYGREDVEKAFRACLDAGLTMFDTAEVYGTGLSERLLGEFNSSARRFTPAGAPEEIITLTKFAALPWRFGSGSVVSALEKSLERLNMRSVDLYQLHWPGVWQNDAYVAGLADCVERGLARAVGVSNYSAARTRRAHEILAARGVKLASNQIQYSLLYRKPERNGVLDTCRELGVTPIAYSPIAQGLLSGKYTPERPPQGPRGRIFTREFMLGIAPLLDLLREVGARYGKTPAQVSINWCICKGSVPIPGAKSDAQVAEIAGALGWRLSEADVRALDDCSAAISVKGFGMPLEDL